MLYHNYISNFKSFANNYTTNVVSVWKYSTLITGGIVFAGTLGHCVYDTIKYYNKYGLSLYLKGDWTYLLKTILGINGQNSSTDIAVNTLQSQLSKININKFIYIYNLTIIGACFGPLITLGIINTTIKKCITNPIQNIYDKYIYENPRFERFTHRLLNEKQKIEEANRIRDDILLRKFNNRVVPVSSFVEDKPVDCPICAIKLEDTDQPLSCGHYIHNECFMQSKNTTCPICRTEVKLSFEQFKLLNASRSIHLPSISLINDIDNNDIDSNDIDSNEIDSNVDNLQPL